MSQDLDVIVFEFIKNNGGSKLRDVMAYTHESNRKVDKSLQRLRKKGLIKASNGWHAVSV